MVDQPVLRRKKSVTRVHSPLPPLSKTEQVTKDYTQNPRNKYKSRSVEINPKDLYRI